jgi:hypothetical protein
MACPICKFRMELMSRQADFVTAGCGICRVTMTMPTAIWDAAKIERDAATVERDIERGKAE